MEAIEYTTLRSLEDTFWWYRGLHRLVLDALADLPPGRVLDGGCGTGGLLSRLAAQHRTIGVDYSPHALRFARERGLPHLLRGSVERIALENGSVDAVVSLDVLYHAAVTDDRVALAEFRRVLRPGGRLVLNLPAFDALRSSHDAAIHTARRYRRAPLSRMLEEAGFVVDRITYWNTLLFPGLAALRFLRKGAAHEEGPPRSDVTELPGWINGTLHGVLRLERALVRRVDLPFGLSLLVVAHRPEDA
ncbi:MAG: class I SAM-dependent methyltransferase [Candidatus Eisenbacteria bacterium]|uniref:Class I SAM-dependent methyltransferase n=1 Tax=Eiseniibacteriota bacterium TaxID=2212470 RepID=A0A956RP09_UNCEI|nr:class I SAM-dependent methyltransferase [Candidatus Eisenbacteria bacterium]